MGEQKKKKKSNVLLNVILVLAIIVFCVSGFQLLRIGKGYKDGQDEYKNIRKTATSKKENPVNPGDDFQIDFDKLYKINPDTIGWIRFTPKPSQINYPIVQGKDNQTYLHKTFSDNENTLGSIFLDAAANPDFNENNSIIYGHRMKDGSMFRHLQDYETKKFWKKYPYFYIYTMDGRKLTYLIAAAGETTEASDVYRTDFSDEKQYNAFIKAIKNMALYDTDVQVTKESSCVTLSTCTGASDEHRFVVVGEKIQEEELE